MESRGDTDSLISEKDATIRQVMEEGEALSIKQAEYEQTIKKLRGKLRQAEADNEGLVEALEAEQASVAAAKAEREQVEAEFSVALEAKKAEAAEAERRHSLEMDDARKKVESAEARVGHETAKLSTAAQREIAAKEEALNETVAALRTAMTVQEEQSALREEMLRKTIDDQKTQLHESESRNEELSARLPGATRPLMRQLEAMHRQMEESSASWSATEKSLTRRVTEAQSAAAAATERERLMREERSEDAARIAAADAQKETLRAEMHSVQNQLKRTRDALAKANEELHGVQEEQKYDMEKATGRCRELEAEVHALRVGEDNMGERVQALEAELQRKADAVTALEQDLKNEVTKSQRLSDSIKGKAIIGAAPPAPAPAAGNHVDGDGSYDAFMDGGEALRSELRRRDGELRSAREQISQLEATRARLADELLTSARDEEVLQSTSDALGALQVEFEDLQQRHVSALELMGERDEQIEDLMADLSEIKGVFRQQMDAMATQLEEAQGKGR